MSHETFSIGEIAILVRVGGAGNVGDEVEVCRLSGCGWHSDNLPRHSVVGTDGFKYCVPVEDLRKRRPPPQREATSSWDDVIVWKPREVEHV